MNARRTTSKKGPNAGWSKKQVEAQRAVLKVFPEAVLLKSNVAGWRVLPGRPVLGEELTELGCGWSRARAWENAAREVALYERRQKRKKTPPTPEQKLHARLPLTFEWVGPVTDAKFGLVLATAWMRDTFQHVHVRREGRGLFKVELLTWTNDARKTTSMVARIDLTAPTLRAVKLHAERVVRAMAAGYL